MTETAVIYANKRQRAKLAQAGIVPLAEYDDYVLADITPEQVVALRTQGYEVEIQDAPATIEVRGRPVAMVTSQETTRSTDRALPANISIVPAGPPPNTLGPGIHYYLVQFIGPVKHEWLDAVVAHGGTIQDPVPPYGYILGLDQPAYEQTTAQAYVRFVGHYTADLRLAPGVTGAPERDPAVGRGRILERSAVRAEPPPNVERLPNSYVVRFFEAADLDQAAPLIEGMGGTVGSHPPGATTLTVSFPVDTPDSADKATQIAHLHGIKSVESQVLRQLYNDVAAGLMGAQEVIAPSGLGLSGRGEIVGVGDSGLDTGNPATIHPDFAGRVAALRSWPVSSGYAGVVTNVGGDDGPADTRSGHGTHVTGSICGSGAASQAAQGIAIRGLAAEAQVVFQAIEQTLHWTEAYRQDYYRRFGRYPPTSGLAGLPADLRTFFQQAYDAGARVHNNSWGGGDFGEYDSYAEFVDRFMWEHKEFLILFAAGNDGADADHNGVIDTGSVMPPGTAKNCLTVGAAESVRSQGGYQATYGQLWPSDYPAQPLRGDKASDNGDDIAAFSSRGPTRDGRIKPDLVAPGTNIVSVRSQALDVSADGWGAYAPIPDKYMYNGGTSMATPLTAGAAAVVRQYLRTVKGRRTPSAALVKGTLIHAAQHRPYRHEPDTAGLDFDMSQGWGHVHLESVLAPQAPIQVRWYDYTRGLRTGESMRWSCTVADTSVPVAITLIWTDYPGSAGHYPNLVNDLDLVVTSPSGKTTYGNCRADQADCRLDRANNVERMIILSPELGRYQIRVRAFNVPRGPQAFALVYSGGIR
ncbi:MAG: S8 family serine peptidase [Anaerolineae bacterium]|nr:S8 family serine peptidase [Anaerolineae bacterium]